MKRLEDVLSAEERAHRDKSLDASLAPTDMVRRKIKTVRDFLDGRCYMNAEAQEKWGKATEPMRLRILSELIWRTNCVLDKSVTAVEGLKRFDLGYGFKVHHTEVDGKEALVIISV